MTALHLLATTQHLLTLLAAADAIQVDQGPLLSSWETEDPIGDPDNVVITATWEDTEGTYTTEITESGLAAGTWSAEGVFECFDSNGHPALIELFSLKRITLEPPQREERVLLHLPSCQGSGGEYDLLVQAPLGMTLAAAKDRVSTEIWRANEEYARNESGNCDDGLGVEDSLKAALTLEGFTFVKPPMTGCWNELCK